MACLARSLGWLTTCCLPACLRACLPALALCVAGVCLPVAGWLAGPRGASRLAEAVLRSGSRVASLHLHSNRVGAMGAAAIAKALVQASSCEEGGGPMGGGGSLALLDLR